MTPHREEVRALLEIYCEGSLHRATVVASSVALRVSPSAEHDCAAFHCPKVRAEALSRRDHVTNEKDNREQKQINGEKDSREM